MMRIILAAAFLTTSAAAHEMTPTYVEFKPSYVEGVHVTSVNIWNRRNDVEYYELSVVDENWNSIPFAARNRILKLSYLGRTSVDVYVKEEDIANVEFVCTSSKQLKSDVKSTGIKSMICSRIER